MRWIQVQRSLEIGSYQTAWAMLHRVRSVLVRPGRERLQGRVEVDESYIGGGEPGLSGGRAQGEEVPGRHSRRADRAGGLGPLPDDPARRRVRGLAAEVPRGQRAGGRNGAHRRLAALPAGDQGAVHPRAPRRRGGDRGGQATARRAPRGFARQAVAARHPPRLGGKGPPGQLPQ